MNLETINSENIIPLTIIISLTVFFRYVLVSGGFYVVFYILGKKRFERRKISEQLRTKGQSWKEIGWSALTSAIFGVFGVAMLYCWQAGYMAIYEDWGAYGYWYLPVSFLLVLLIQETYYYWLHRWMHRPKVYRRIHKVHHDSIVTSPWTAFSFHPIESLLQAVFVPALAFILPLHIGVVLILLTLMTISATINHLDIEIYPKGFESHWLGKWLVGATHHSLHHSKFLFNYGLYFTFWDKWMDTESPLFVDMFREKTN